MNTATVFCPRCRAEVPHKAKCKVCKGGLKFEDFHAQIMEICALERVYNLQDPRKESQ